MRGLTICKSIYTDIHICICIYSCVKSYVYIHEIIHDTWNNYMNLWCAWIHMYEMTDLTQRIYGKLNSRAWIYTWDSFIRLLIIWIYIRKFLLIESEFNKLSIIKDDSKIQNYEFRVMHSWFLVMNTNVEFIYCEFVFTPSWEYLWSQILRSTIWWTQTHISIMIGSFVQRARRCICFVMNQQADVFAIIHDTTCLTHFVKQFPHTFLTPFFFASVAPVFTAVFSPSSTTLHSVCHVCLHFLPHSYDQSAQPSSARFHHSHQARLQCPPHARLLSPCQARLYSSW